MPKRHPKQLPPEQVDELVAAYVSGMTAKAVAAQFGIHRSTVAVHLERRGIPRGVLKVMTPELTERARVLRGEGLSYQRIAAHFGVDKMTVWRTLAV